MTERGDRIAASIWAGIFPEVADDAILEKWKKYKNYGESEQWLWDISQYGKCHWCANTGWVLDGWDRKTSKKCPMENHEKHPPVK